MMKKIVTLIIVCIGLISHAQDNKAKSLLKEVAQKFKSYENVVFTYKGNFKNTSNQMDMDVQGKATLSGEKYHVSFLGSTYIFDGKKQYVINEEDEQITIATQDDSEDQLITPSNILTFYEKGYTASWDIEQNVRGRKIQYIKLLPIKSDSEYEKVLLGIDSATNHIYNAIITEKHSGSVATFTLLTLKVNQPLAPSTFTFNAAAYDGWDIESLD